LTSIAAILGSAISTLFCPWGMFSSPAAQPPAVPEPAASTPAGQRVPDVTTRYRFLERYTVLPDRTRPEAISQYQVAVLETVKLSRDQTKGAPVRSQSRIQTIFSERPAQVSSAGEVTDTVRHYETCRVTDEPPRRTTGAQAPRWLEGLTVWYHPQLVGDPQVLVLTENRPLREYEYDLVTRQVALPALSGVLPGLPIRVGDKWGLSKAAVQAILGQRPLRGGNLIGTFLELRQDRPGNPTEAIIGIGGMATLPLGETVVNARIHFLFTPAAPANAAGATAVEEGTVDARGAITQLRLAMASTSGLPGSNERLRRSITRELIVERKLTPGSSPLAIPERTPEPTEANSWLTFDDPQGRFHFRHPQDLRPDPNFPEGIVLARPRPEGNEWMDLRFQMPSEDPQQDRQLRDPDLHSKQFVEHWRQRRTEVYQGPSEWLPDSDWAPLKRRVHRTVVVIKRGSSPASKSNVRVNVNLYLIVFSRRESFFIEAYTAQDSPVAFQKQVEAVIRSLEFGPSPISTATAAAR
jgi:hypothetical protein